MVGFSKLQYSVKRKMLSRLAVFFLSADLDFERTKLELFDRERNALYYTQP